jgi:pilus assembly protein Flp/PilA
MAAMRNKIVYFAHADGGATAIEYGLIAALMALAIIASMMVAGDGLSGLFEAVRDRTMEVLDNADV